MIMDGRDIGSVVFPYADLKLFVTCSPEVRALRRTKQLEKGGENVDYNQVLWELIERDKKDQSRELCPLIKPDDAYVIDTSKISINEGVVKALRYASRDPFCKEFLNRNKAQAIVDYFQNTHTYRNYKK